MWMALRPETAIPAEGRKDGLLEGPRRGDWPRGEPVRVGELRDQGSVVSGGANSGECSAGSLALGQAGLPMAPLGMAPPFHAGARRRAPPASEV